jgi:hypothetical protein
LNGSVTQQPGSAVTGSVKTLDADLAALGLLLIPAFILLFIGFGFATVAAALLVAAFGARQVRAVESLIVQKPGHVLLAGIAGMVAFPFVAMVRHRRSAGLRRPAHHVAGDRLPRLDRGSDLDR